MAKTKIVVLKRKQLLYTGVLAIIALLAVIVVSFLFLHNDPEDQIQSPEAALYEPGVYSTVITLNDTTLNLELTLDKNHVNAVRIVNLDESVATMYPLIQPSLARLEEQLVNGVAIETIEVTEDSRFTQIMLLDALKDMLDEATVKQAEEES